MNYLIQGLILLVGIFIGAFIVAITFINNQISIDQDTIIAAAATFIAACAFGLTFWQGYITRQHNKLSVSPELQFDTRLTNQYIKLKILNVGIGPAIINDFFIVVDDKEAIGQATPDNLRRMADMCFDDPFIGLVSPYGLDQGTILGAGEEHIFLQIQIKDNYDQDGNLNVTRLWRKANGRITIYYKFQSIYKEQSDFMRMKLIFPT